MLNVYINSGKAAFKQACTDKHTVIVVDVLRASSTIIAAMAAGISEINVSSKLLHDKHALTVGERSGEQMAKTDYNNSPNKLYSYQGDKRKMLLTTTNFAPMLLAGKTATNSILVGAILNAKFVAKAAEQLAAISNKPISIIMAGRLGKLCEADLMGASTIFQAFTQAKCQSTIQPIAIDNIEQQLAKTPASQHLTELGLADDVAFAAKLNYIDKLPRCFRIDSQQHVAYIKEHGHETTAAV